ncbi:hypothetical protein P691DRAFT_771879 [Macrolepiota fuliginosa MF-IS2]|uniref:Geranylgeranyl pyrophosphate synthetase n=1 Tax=Macrolepiota fuliginosa MF-IS2 TaxID=1400762 RepID=A0A9P5XM69_9AGAR|nr:hypothetical protein P691DRAFT_771879 [Macrolepiota fuliginosa MF-IS2]
MPARSPLVGLSKPLFTIGVPRPNPEMAERTTDLLENCQYIGSYDWLPSESSKNNLTIVVPGSPNVWVDPALPLRVNPDKGKHFRDYSGHVSPGRPLAPVIAAVHEQQIFPQEDWKKVDFFTDRNGLRKLLRWVTQVKRDFRIDTQLVGEKTVVLNRWESGTTEFMRGNTYGFNFEKATTRAMPPAEERSAWHHRVVTYTFGRLRLVVSFEVDGCLSPDEPDPSASQGDEVEALVNAMANMGHSSQGPSASAASNSSANTIQGRRSQVFGLNILHRGNGNIPNSSILEMTTASSLRWSERYPQLYFSQTGNHFTGHRTNGTFHSVSKRSLLSPELQSVQARMQPAFKKLEEALNQIQSIVIEHGKQEHLTLIYEKPSLTVHRRLKRRDCLPREALALFE